MSKEENDKRIIGDLVKESGVYRVKKATMNLNKFRKLYNKLCSACKNKVIKNSKMKVEEYCIKCQEKIKRIKL